MDLKFNNNVRSTDLSNFKTGSIINRPNVSQGLQQIVLNNVFKISRKAQIEGIHKLMQQSILKIRWVDNILFQFTLMKHHLILCIVDKFGFIKPRLRHFEWAQQNTNLQILGSIRLRTSIFHFNLRRIYIIEKRFVSVLACNHEFRSSVAVHESRKYFPEKAHYARSVEDERFLQSAGIVHGDAGNDLLNGRVGQIPNIVNTVQIVDDVPIFYLARQQQMLKHLLKGVDGCLYIGLHIVRVHRANSEYDNWPETFVSPGNVIEARFLKLGHLYQDVLEFLKFQPGYSVQPEVGIVFHALEGLLVAVLVGNQNVEHVMVVVVDGGVEFFAFPLQVLIILPQLLFLVVIMFNLSEKVKADSLLIC